MVELTLDKCLAMQGITRYELAKRTGIRFQIIDNYYKNKVVRYDGYVLDRICEALGCKIEDILTYTPQRHFQNVKIAPMKIIGAFFMLKQWKCRQVRGHLYRRGSPR